MKCGCPRAELLITLRVLGKQSGDLRRHLIGCRSQYTGRRGRRCRVGRAQCRPDTGHVRGRRNQRLRRRENERHPAPPLSPQRAPASRQRVIGQSIDS